MPNTNNSDEQFEKERLLKEGVEDEDPDSDKAMVKNIILCAAISFCDKKYKNIDASINSLKGFFEIGIWTKYLKTINDDIGVLNEKIDRFQALNEEQKRIERAKADEIRERLKKDAEERKVLKGLAGDAHGAQHTEDDPVVLVSMNILSTKYPVKPENIDLELKWLNGEFKKRRPKANFQLGGKNYLDVYAVAVRGMESKWVLGSGEDKGTKGKVRRILASISRFIQISPLDMQENILLIIAESIKNFQRSYNYKTSKDKLGREILVWDEDPSKKDKSACGPGTAGILAGSIYMYLDIVDYEGAFKRDYPLDQENIAVDFMNCIFSKPDYGYAGLKKELEDGDAIVKKLLLKKGELKTLKDTNAGRIELISKHKELRGELKRLSELKYADADADAIAIRDIETKIKKFERMHVLSSESIAEAIKLTDELQNLKNLQDAHAVEYDNAIKDVRTQISNLEQKLKKYSTSVEIEMASQISELQKKSDAYNKPLEDSMHDWVSKGMQKKYESESEIIKTKAYQDYFSEERFTSLDPKVIFATAISRNMLLFAIDNCEDWDRWKRLLSAGKYGDIHTEILGFLSNFFDDDRLSSYSGHINGIGENSSSRVFEQEFKRYLGLDEKERDEAKRNAEKILVNISVTEKLLDMLNHDKKTSAVNVLSKLIYKYGLSEVKEKLILNKNIGFYDELYVEVNEDIKRLCSKNFIKGETYRKYFPVTIDGIDMGDTYKKAIDKIMMSCAIAYVDDGIVMTARSKEVMDFLRQFFGEDDLKRYSDNINDDVFKKEFDRYRKLSQEGKIKEKERMKKILVELGEGTVPNIISEYEKNIAIPTAVSNLIDRHGYAGIKILREEDSLSFEKEMSEEVTECVRKRFSSDPIISETKAYREHLAINKSFDVSAVYPKIMAEKMMLCAVRYSLFKWGDGNHVAGKIYSHGFINEVLHFMGIFFDENDMKYYYSNLSNHNLSDIFQKEYNKYMGLNVLDKDEKTYWIDTTIIQAYSKKFTECRQKNEDLSVKNVMRKLFDEMGYFGLKRKLQSPDNSNIFLKIKQEMQTLLCDGDNDLKLFMQKSKSYQEYFYSKFYKIDLAHAFNDFIADEMLSYAVINMIDMKGESRKGESRFEYLLNTNYESIRKMACESLDGLFDKDAVKYFSDHVNHVDFTRKLNEIKSSYILRNNIQGNIRRHQTHVNEERFAEILKKNERIVAVDVMRTLFNEKGYSWLNDLYSEHRERFDDEFEKRMKNLYASDPSIQQTEAYKKYFNAIDLERHSILSLRSSLPDYSLTYDKFIVDEMLSYVTVRFTAHFGKEGFEHLLEKDYENIRGMACRFLGIFFNKDDLECFSKNISFRKFKTKLKEIEEKPHLESEISKAMKAHINYSKNKKSADLNELYKYKIPKFFRYAIYEPLDFEGVAKSLAPDRRKEIEVAIKSLKDARAVVEALELKLKKMTLDLSSKNLSSEKRKDIEKDIEKLENERNRDRNNVTVLELQLKKISLDLGNLKDEIDSKKQVNKSLVKRILATMSGLITITGETSLRLEIKRIESEVKNDPKNILRKLIDLFVKLIDSARKFINNMALTIKASIKNIEGYEYEKTSVPNFLRQKKKPKP